MQTVTNYIYTLHIIIIIIEVADYKVITSKLGSYKRKVLLLNSYHKFTSLWMYKIEEETKKWKENSYIIFIVLLKKIFKILRKNKIICMILKTLHICTIHITIYDKKDRKKMWIKTFLLP